MKARLLSTAVVLGLTFGLTPAQAATAPKTYQLYCRGTLSAGVRSSLGTTFVTGTRHSGAAGENGANLPEGTCAWKNRALHANEKPGIYLTKALQDRNPAYAPLVLTCAHDSDCIIMAWVSRVSYGQLATTNPNFGIDTYQK